MDAGDQMSAVAKGGVVAGHASMFFTGGIVADGSARARAAAARTLAMPAGTRRASCCAAGKVNAIRRHRRAVAYSSRIRSERGR